MPDKKGSLEGGILQGYNERHPDEAGGFFSS